MILGRNLCECCSVGPKEEAGGNQDGDTEQPVGRQQTLRDSERSRYSTCWKRDCSKIKIGMVDKNPIVLEAQMFVDPVS